MSKTPPMFARPEFDYFENRDTAIWVASYAAFCAIRNQKPERDAVYKFLDDKNVPYDTVKIDAYFGF